MFDQLLTQNNHQLISINMSKMNNMNSFCLLIIQ
jgi:hypothetical protein